MKNYLFVFIFVLFAGFANGQNPRTGEMAGIDSCAPKVISLAVHVLLDSLNNPGITSNIYERDIDSLNAHFAPLCIQFRICEVNEISHNRWDYRMVQGERDQEIADTYIKPNMINIFYSQTVIGGNSGFSQQGDTIAPPQDPLRDAIFLQKYSGKNVMLHVFGHYFGLYNTNETQFGAELTDGSNCETAGDKICDTPADDGSGQIDQFCNFHISSQDANGEYYTPDVCNLMGPYGACSYLRFTTGQYNRMLEVALKGRSYLW